MVITVHNRITGAKLTYTCTAEQAVIAAYAQQERSDYNTWNYAKRYSHLLERNGDFVTCGDWTTKVN